MEELPASSKHLLSRHLFPINRYIYGIRYFISADFDITACVLKFVHAFYSVLNFQDEESYICIYSGRDEDCILFYHAGGIDIGNVEEKAQLIKIPTEGSEISTTNEIISDEKMMNLLKHLNPSKIK